MNVLSDQKEPGGNLIKGDIQVKQYPSIFSSVIRLFEKWCYYGGSSDEYKSSKDFLNCCEKQARREAVGQVILQALRRLKDKEPTEC